MIGLASHLTALLMSEVDILEPWIWWYGDTGEFHSWSSEWVWIKYLLMEWHGNTRKVLISVCPDTLRYGAEATD